MGILIADTGNNRVANAQFALGSSNATANLLADGLSKPAAVTVSLPTYLADFTAEYGFAYVADTGNSRVLSESDGLGEAMVSSGIESPGGLAVDSTGNVYIADTTTDPIRKLATGLGAAFGNVKVGSELTVPLTLAFLQPGKISTSAVVTQGA